MQAQDTMKKMLSLMLENSLDFGDSFSNVQDVVNKPQYSHVKNNPQFGQRMDMWYSELLSTTVGYRRNLWRLFNDFKYLAGSFKDSEQLFDELDMSKENLQNAWETDISVRQDSSQVDDKLRDLLKVVYPNYYRPSAVVSSPSVNVNVVRSPTPPPQVNQSAFVSTPIQSSRIVNTQQTTTFVGRDASPPPRSYKIDQFGNKVYLDEPNGYSTAAPRLSNVSASPVRRPSNTTVTIQDDRNRSPSPLNYSTTTFTPYGSQALRPTTTTNVSMLPSTSTYQPSSNTKIYTIDPITGERREKVDSLNGMSYSTLSPIQSSRVITNPSTVAYPPPSTTYQQPKIVVQPSTTYQPGPVYPQNTTTYVTPPPTTTYINGSTLPYNGTTSTIRPSNTQPIYTSTIVQPPPVKPAAEPPKVQAEPVLDKDTIKMLDDAKRDYGNPVIELFQADDFPSKVEVSKDGKRVYYGGDSFGTLEQKNGWLLNEGIVYDNKCCTLKALDSGDILINNFDNWDLVLLDSNFNEKGKLSGSSRSLPTNYKKIKTRNSEDDSHLLWLSGPENLSVVKTSNLSSNEIRFFWKFNNKNVNPVACAISPSGKKIVGIGETDNSHTLHFYDGSDSVVIYQREDVHEPSKVWESLEINYDEDTFFIGGGDDISNAYLMAFTLNEEADLIRERVFPGRKSISALRRHNEGEILFAGAFKVVFVLFYHQKQFHILKEVPLPIDRPTRDIAFNPNDVELYTVHDFDKGAVIYFEGKALTARNPANNIAPAKRVKRKLGQAPPPPPTPKRIDPTPYDPLNQGYLTYDERLKQVKKPPMHASNFKDFNVKQIQLPNSSLRSSSQAAAYPGESQSAIHLLRQRRAESTRAAKQPIHSSEQRQGGEELHRHQTAAHR